MEHHRAPESSYHTQVKSFTTTKGHRCTICTLDQGKRSPMDMLMGLLQDHANVRETPNPNLGFSNSSRMPYSFAMAAPSPVNHKLSQGSLSLPMVAVVTIIPRRGPAAWRACPQAPLLWAPHLHHRVPFPGKWHKMSPATNTLGTWRHPSSLKGNRLWRKKSVPHLDANGTLWFHMWLFSWLERCGWGERAPAFLIN